MRRRKVKYEIQSDDKDLLKTLKMLFGFEGYTEMFSRVNNDTGLRENGITILRTEERHPDLDNYQVTINWKLLDEIIGVKNER